MPTIPQSTHDCAAKLKDYNGKFFNGLMCNFEHPKIFNDSTYNNALLGDLTISLRNYIGKYNGAYLLYKRNDIDLIRIKIKSNDNKCGIETIVLDEERNKVSFEKDAIILTFEDFINFLPENRFSLVP